MSRTWDWLRKKIKRPLAAVLICQLTFLFFVMILFPSAGDRLFGWSQKEASARIWLEERSIHGNVSINGKVLSRTASSYGFQYVVRTEAGFRCWMYLDERYDPGDQLRIKGKVSWPAKAMNPGEWDRLSYAREKNILCTLRSDEVCLEKKTAHPVLSFFACSRDEVSERIALVFDSPYDGIAAAMLTGDRSRLPQEEAELFASGGISHIIAISGLHFSVLAELLTGLLSKVMSKRKAGTVSAILLLGYAFWSGGSTATLRAAIMHLIKSEAEPLGKDYDHWSAMAFSAAIILMTAPERFLSSSFYLSYGSLVGTFVGGKLLVRIKKIPYLLRKWLAGSFGVTLITLPMILFFYFEASPVSVFLNLWVIPLTGAVLILSLAALALSAIHPLLAAGPAWIVQLILKSFEKTCEWTIRLPMMMLRGRPGGLMLFLFYAGAGLLLLSSGRQGGKRMRRPLAAGSVLCLAAIMMFAGGHYFRKTVSFLYVGQGDCSVIEWKNKVVVIDAGPSYEDVIEPFLKREGVRRIDALFITHPDSDHMEGANQLLADERFVVKSVILSDSIVQQTEEMAEIKRLCQERGLRVIFAETGERITFSTGVKGRSKDDVSFRILSGSENYEDINDSSLVILATLGDLDILFPGDISFPAEEKLMKDGAVSKVQILKAGHHGAATSTGENWLKVTDPDMVIFSCGIDNAYHHPSAETVDRVEEAGIKWYATSESGCVQITYRRGRYIIDTYRGEDK